MIKKSSALQVYSPLRLNFEGLHGHILTTLPSDMSVQFASFQRTVDSYTWSHKDNDWTPLSNVDAATCDQAMQVLSECKQAICDARKVHDVVDNLEVIFTVPGYDYLYCRKDSQGKMQVLITGWGFSNMKNLASKNVIIPFPKKKDTVGEIPPVEEPPVTPPDQTVETKPEPPVVVIKKPCNWWKWLLAAAGIALLIWLLLQFCNRRTDEPVKEELESAVTVLVMSAINDEKLPDAKVQWELSSGSSGSEKTDLSGQAFVTIKNLMADTLFKTIQVSCAGFADTIVRHKYVDDIPGSVLPVKLRPLGLQLSFTIINATNGEPVPGALAEVLLDNKDGVVSSTNVDGQGHGIVDIDNPAIPMAIRVSKPGYESGEFDWTPYGADHTAASFAKLTKEQCVIRLKPIESVDTFVAIDVYTKKPIAGAKHHIVITHADGSKTELDAVSNKNGKFDVPVKPGEGIAITSKAYPKYKVEETEVDGYEGPITIEMIPSEYQLSFRIINPVTKTLEPGCKIAVFVNNEPHTGTVDDKGNGEFTVKGLSFGDKITIHADRDNLSNHCTVVNAGRAKLEADPALRDIPLGISYEYHRGTGGTGGVVEVFNYDMGEGAPYEFELFWKHRCAQCTTIEVWDGDNLLIGKKDFTDGGKYRYVHENGRVRLKANNRMLKVVANIEHMCDCHFFVTRLYD